VTILACVVPESQVEPAVSSFAAMAPAPVATADELKRHFAATQKYGDVPAKRGEERGAFGLFVDPGHCKGCAECVEVCSARGAKSASQACVNGSCADDQLLNRHHHGGCVTAVANLTKKSSAVFFAALLISRCPSWASLPPICASTT